MPRTCMKTQFILDLSAWDAFVAALDRPAQIKQPIVDLLRRPRPT